MASIDVSTGLGKIPSPRQLARGALFLEGPEGLIVSWAIIAVLAYLSSSVGLVGMIVVGLLGTALVLVGLLWLAARSWV